MDKMNAMRSQKYIEYIRCFIRYFRFRVFVNGCARLLVRFFLAFVLLNELFFMFVYSLAVGNCDFFFGLLAFFILCHDCVMTIIMSFKLAQPIPIMMLDGKQNNAFCNAHSTTIAVNRNKRNILALFMGCLCSRQLLTT